MGSLPALASLSCRQRECHQRPGGLQLEALHRLPVSLAHNGAGIGTVFAEGLAKRLLSEAGFTGIEA